METYELHYASIAQWDFDQDIPMQEFKKFNELLNEIDQRYIDNAEAQISNSIVYLFCASDKQQASPPSIYIDTNNLRLQNIIKSHHKADRVFHIHEYRSYEDAYAVALHIREPFALCYSQQ